MLGLLELDEVGATRSAPHPSRDLVVRDVRHPACSTNAGCDQIERRTAELVSQVASFYVDSHVADSYHVAPHVSSISHFRNHSKAVTLRGVQRGVFLGDVLPALLKARGLSQKKFGDKAGIPREDINNICRGKLSVGAVRLERIATALGVDPEDLRAAASTEDAADSPPIDLAHLLAELEDEAEGPVALVARALVLLARRLELVERQQARAVQ